MSNFPFFVPCNIVSYRIHSPVCSCCMVPAAAAFEQKERRGYQDAGASPSEVARYVKRNVAGSASMCMYTCVRVCLQKADLQPPTERLSSSGPTVPIFVSHSAQVLRAFVSFFAFVPPTMIATM